ncbi:MAG: type 1 glutamine amidotransferase [Ruminococcus sp.]|nr:type 1 glutamine amidotransferase [Ruminococcus sp.]
MSDEKIIIGIVPQYRTDSEKTFTRPWYPRMISRAGALPLMPAADEGCDGIRQWTELCGGILFTGGPDVDPHIYGEDVRAECGEIVPVRDAFEKTALELALELDKPVFGICRGIQSMNVFCGGSLFQDIPTDIASPLTHDKSVHDIEVKHGTLLADIIGSGVHEVNSYHHQSVREPASGFEVAATSSDGVIEALFMPERRFVIGVQWHPELMHESEISRKLFAAFIAAAKQRQEEKL